MVYVMLLLNLLLAFVSTLLTAVNIVINVQVKLDLCITDLQKVKSLLTPHLQELKNDLQIVPQGSLKGQHEISLTKR